MELLAVDIGQDAEAQAAFGEAMLRFVPEEKAARLNRYKKRADFLRSLTAELLIRVQLARELKLDNQEIVFAVNRYGKPYLQDRSLQFNLSHAGEWVVAAVSRHPVGIDIEPIKPIDLGIAKRFFSEKEYRQLLEQKEGERLPYFFSLWTLKESYIKAVGTGLSLPLNSFSFTLDETGIGFEHNDGVKLPELDSSCACNERFFFRQYELNPDYKLAVCHGANRFPEEVTVWDLPKLHQESVRVLSCFGSL